MRESSVPRFWATLKPLRRGLRPGTSLRQGLGLGVFLAAGLIGQTVAQAEGQVQADAGSRADLAADGSQRAGGRARRGKAAGRQARAEQLYRQGLAALKDKRYKAAVADLDASYRASPRPQTMYTLAIAYSGLGYPDKAVEAFAAYVDFADPETDAALLAAVRAEMERITKSVARFRVSLTPTNAQLLIDGQPIALKNNQLWLKPGQHRIAIRAKGHEPFAKDVDVTQGHYTLEVHLRPLKVAPEERVRALLKKADAQVQAGDLLGAVHTYEAAEALIPTPHGAGAAGLSLEQLGHLAAAETQVLQALRQGRDPWVRAHRGPLRAAKQRLEKALGTLSVAGDENTVGAMVWVNGRAVGRLPLPEDRLVRVEGGAVTVKASLAGYEPFVHTLTVEPQAEREVFVELEKAEVTPVGLALPSDGQGVPQVEVVAKPASKVEAPAAPEAPLPASPDVVAAALPEASVAAEVLEPDEEPETAAPVVASVAPFKPVVPAPPLAEPEEEVSEPKAPRTMDTPWMAAREAAGIEINTGLGYQAVLAGGTAGSSGGLAGRLLSLGYRPVWPVSVGVQLLNGSVDWGTAGTQVVADAHPGFYLRAHSQRERAIGAFDLWGGVGFQPVGFSIGVFEREDAPASTRDVSQLETLSGQDVAADEGQTELSDKVTYQSYNVPLEFGVSFYLTPDMAVEFASALTFWIPVQECYSVDATGNRVCYDDDLTRKSTFYVGVGLAFLE